MVYFVEKSEKMNKKELIKLERVRRKDWEKIRDKLSDIEKAEQLVNCHKLVNNHYVFLNSYSETPKWNLYMKVLRVVNYYTIEVFTIERTPDGKYEAIIRPQSPSLRGYRKITESRFNKAVKLLFKPLGRVVYGDKAR